MIDNISQVLTTNHLYDMVVVHYEKNWDRPQFGLAKPN